MMACVGCGTDNPAGARFCFKCGSPFQATCPHCGQVIAVTGAAFCMSCGQPLVRSDEDLMLKVVSVLFADVVSSTERAERMFPDEVRDLMKEFFAAMTEEIVAEGGHIDKFIGDAVLALFGVPVAREDDAVRALRAAKRMLARTESFNRERDPLHQVFIRIGINTGEVLADAQDSQFRVTGDTVNVASRLESKAPKGEILIGRRTARLVGDRFELEEIEPLELKGKSRPVAAFLVRAEKERIRYAAARSPMIGREKELASLHEALAGVVAASHPSLVTIVADPGVGKSRLLDEFYSAAVDAGHVSGRCLPYGEGVTLWPLNEILMNEAGILLDDSRQLVEEKLHKLVEAKLPADADEGAVLHGLVATMGRLDEDAAGLDPRELFREIVDAWAMLLQGLAEAGPQVVIVEDIHWADASMLEVLRRLVESVSAPVLFIATARPDLAATHPELLVEDDGHAVIRLEPLNTEGGERLVQHLLGGSEIPATLRHQILHRSEGNPFFVEEIINRLMDQGLLQRSGTGWQATGDLSGIEVPDNIQGVILSRIDLLKGSEKRAVQLASVVGRVFWPGVLLKLGCDELVTALDGLERRGLIRRAPSSSVSGETEYAFKHILIRDVAYETLPRKKRAQAHLDVASWITDINAERADEFAELLAHHYASAFKYSRDDAHRREARGHYLVAAGKAGGRFAMEQAVTLGRAAIDLSSEGDELAEAYEGLGDSYFLAFDVNDAWGAFTEGRRALGDRHDDPAWSRLTAKAALVATRWDKALDSAPDAAELLAIIREGLSRSEGSERAMLLVARAFYQVAGYEAMDDEGRDAAQAALRSAEEAEDADLMSAALDAQACWLMPEGLHGQVAEINRRRLELIPRSHDVREICDSYIVAAWSSAFAGRYTDALEAASACVDRATGVDLGSYVLGLIERVHARALLGDFAGALADQAEIERLEGSGVDALPGPHSWKAFAFAALCHRARGDKSEFERYLELTRRFDQEAGVTAREGQTLRAAVVARSLTQAGRFDEARPLIAIRPGAVIGSHLEAYLDLLAATKQWDELDDMADLAFAEAERAGLRALPFFAERALGARAADQRDLDAARTSMRTSIDGFDGLGARWEGAHTRLAWGEALLGAGQEGEAYAELDKAYSTMQELGAETDADRARQALVAIGAETRTGGP